VPPEGALHPLDLADVDPEAEDLHAGSVAAEGFKLDPRRSATRP
jgi:hypothetical protein